MASDGVWVLGGLVSVVMIGVARRGLDGYLRLPITVRERAGWAAGTAFDWYAWWEGWDV